jgi:hypothetical protein
LITLSRGGPGNAGPARSSITATPLLTQAPVID